jgi:hypothetical protein
VFVDNGFEKTLKNNHYFTFLALFQLDFKIINKSLFLITNLAASFTNI